MWQGSPVLTVSTRRSDEHNRPCGEKNGSCNDESREEKNFTPTLSFGTRERGQRTITRLPSVIKRKDEQRERETEREREREKERERKREREREKEREKERELILSENAKDNQDLFCFLISVVDCIQFLVDCIKSMVDCIKLCSWLFLRLSNNYSF